MADGSSPAFADIDGDGDLDAFVGHYLGHTFFFANTGTANAPAFAGGTANAFGLADVGDESSPAFADLDGDGDLDAFVGEFWGRTVYFENEAPAPAPGCGIGPELLLLGPLLAAARRCRSSPTHPRSERIAGRR